MTTLRQWGSALLLLLTAGACGGKAIIDSPDTGVGGAGGSGGTSSSTSTGCIPLTCAGLPCGIEAPDGCGGLIFCGCGECTQLRGPHEVLSVGTPESNRVWETPGNAILSDDNNATVSAMVQGDVSELLLGRAFDFELPEDAFVTGVEVRVERRALAGVGLVDHQVSLVLGGAVEQNSKALPNVWEDDEETVVYGGPGDLWGSGVTASDVETDLFGLALATRYDSIAGNDWPRVDAMTIRVHFQADECP